ncbi:UTP--glucose-1-phosphate uridylyltransferase 3 chloroplastic [Bienertia sinuspersici]
MFLIKCVVAAGQEHVISYGIETTEDESSRSSLKSALFSLAEMIESWNMEGSGAGNGKMGTNKLMQEEIIALKKLLKTLTEMERFYDCLGGIIGYQITVLELLAESVHGQNMSSSQHMKESMKCQFVEIHSPKGVDLSKNTEYASQAAIWGIEIDLVSLTLTQVNVFLQLCFPIVDKLCLKGLLGTPVSNVVLCFAQPLVPAISANDGEWLVSEPFTPVCKPGGHGVIWKLAMTRAFFNGYTIMDVEVQLFGKSETWLCILSENFWATEGINVLVEKKEISGKWAYGFSCIEYTEFDKFGIPGASSSKSLLSEFPANTNILYVDLHSAEQVGSRNDESSLPGLVLNIKKQIEYVDHYGIKHSVPGGRLECTMQNIADNFSNTYPFRCYGTPDGALLDIIRNAYDLLSCCNIKIPEVGGNENYVKSGPPYLIFLHPALGPLWEVSRQKLDGSMIIVAENVMGASSANESGEPMLEYGRRCARCKLQNVSVLNNGIDWESGENMYWKHEVQRNECLKVMLHGNAEFEASDVTLEGNHVYEVPDGYRLKITSANPGISVQFDPVEDSKKDTGSWFWNTRLMEHM